MNGYDESAIGERLYKRTVNRLWIEKHHNRIFDLEGAEGFDYVVATECPPEEFNFFKTLPEVSRFMSHLDDAVRDVTVYRYRNESDVVLML